MICVAHGAIRLEHMRFLMGREIVDGYKKCIVPKPMLNLLDVSKNREVRSFIAAFGFLFDYKKHKKSITVFDPETTAFQ